VGEYAAAQPISSPSFSFLLPPTLAFPATVRYTPFMTDQSLFHSITWRSVYVAHSEPEAYVVAGRLNTQGIETFVHRKPGGDSYGVYIDPLGEVEVLVHLQDYERAMAILEDVSTPEDENDDLDEDT
jgi:hypothetical protein